MYFITVLLFILVPALLLRYLNFLLGLSPTTPEFPTDSISTNTPIPPSSSALEPLVDFPNIQTKPSSSSSSSNWDFPNIQTKPSSSRSSSNWEHDVFLSFRGQYEEGERLEESFRGCSQFIRMACDPGKE
ncbi:hypothetical protein M0R45_004557 [Rubus argutus]|uniref:TIR domain-containing protein n=1 Tax=Rubus argutus TaxID=59490 RepID=A0AAW1YK32_RUBAR